MSTVYERQEAQRALTKRHLAASSADGKETYTVVMEPCQVFEGKQLFTVRVENKHRFGTYNDMWHATNLPAVNARSLANAYWTALRSRHHGK